MVDSFMFSLLYERMSRADVSGIVCICIYDIVIFSSYFQFVKLKNLLKLFQCSVFSPFCERMAGLKVSGQQNVFLFMTL